MLTVYSTRVKSDTDWINNTWDGSQQMMERMLARKHRAPDKQSYIVFDGTKPERHRIHQRLQSKFRHISYPVTETDNPVLTDTVEGEPLPPPADPCRLMIISLKDQQAIPVQDDILLTDMKGVELKKSDSPTKKRKRTKTETIESNPVTHEKRRLNPKTSESSLLWCDFKARFTSVLSPNPPQKK